jgi:hypothetical protein
MTTRRSLQNRDADGGQQQRAPAGGGLQRRQLERFADHLQLLTDPDLASAEIHVGPAEPRGFAQAQTAREGD